MPAMTKVKVKGHKYFFGVRAQGLNNIFNVSKEFIYLTINKFVPMHLLYVGKSATTGIYW